MIDPNALTVILLTLMGGAVLLHVVPQPCRCPSCVQHTRERAAAREEQRVKAHRDQHAYWRNEWGDPRCGSCKAGNEKDRER